jgi:hypothetical protein
MSSTRATFPVMRGPSVWRIGETPNNRMQVRQQGIEHGHWAAAGLGFHPVCPWMPLRQARISTACKTASPPKCG